MSTGDSTKIIIPGITGIAGGEGSKIDSATVTAQIKISILPMIEDIYFAEKVKKYKWESENETYTVKNRGKVSNVEEIYKNKFKNEIADSTIRNIQTFPEAGVNPESLKAKDKIKVEWERYVEDGYELKKIDKGRFRKKITVVAICKGSEGIINIEIHENKGKYTDLVFENPVKFLDGTTEKTNIEFTLNGSEQYQKDIFLRPKEDADLKELVRKVNEREEKNAFLYFKAHVKNVLPQIFLPYKFINFEFLNKEEELFEILLKKVCPVDPNFRSHFVLHCTAGNMLESSIISHTKSNTPNKVRSKAHKYIMDDGKVIEIWPFTEKNVWATKTESKNSLKGQMFHVELNYGSPSVPTQDQYNSLADLYIEASEIEDCWPIIVPHIEIDRGIKDGHGDPTDFDYNKFYDLLRDKGVPIDDIPHFDHDRYWEKEIYKVPWGTDTNSWPPVLKGNPHK